MSVSPRAKICKFLLGRLAVNIEPAMCNAHLPYPWGTALEGGEGGVGRRGVGDGGVIRRGEGMVRRLFRIHKSHGCSIESLDLLFQSLIVAVFTYAIEVWGCAFYSKYLSRIDKLFARCYKLGYCLRQHSILDIRRNRDMKLWQRISSTNTALSDLLPPQRTRQMRTRSHNYILPMVQTSRFKSVFINSGLFNVINI